MYRTERFNPQGIDGLREVWDEIDRQEAMGMVVLQEIMNLRVPRANHSTSRGRARYVLQTVLAFPDDQYYTMTSKEYLWNARQKLNDIAFYAPGIGDHDEGDTVSEYDYFNRSSEVVRPPWMSRRWRTSKGGVCLFYCGIERPWAAAQDELYWDEQEMRRGKIVFKNQKIINRKLLK